MISWIGGKSKIGTWIRSFIPNNIETYVEPFSGAFWVFFRMDLPQYKNLKNVIYSDVNPLNVNLFLCVKDYQKLWDMTRNIPVENAELFNQFKGDIFNQDFTLDTQNPNFEIAYKYAYVLSQLWSGTDPRRGKLIKNGGYTGKDGVYKSKFEIFQRSDIGNVDLSFTNNGKVPVAFRNETYYIFLFEIKSQSELRDQKIETLTNG